MTEEELNVENWMDYKYITKSFQLLLGPPQIPNSLYWYGTSTFTVRGQQLRVRIMPRPYSIMNHATAL